MKHPPLQKDWINQTHRRVELGDFQLENAQIIHDAFLSYVVHGDLDSKLPVILGLTAIGSTHHRLDFLTGDGLAIEPSRYVLIVIDAIGNGLSISPSNSMRQHGMLFPQFTIRDMVHSQKKALELLNIGKLHAVIGASMGGMQALQWAVSYPSQLERVVAMTPMAKTSAWAQLINETSRKILMSHPGWQSNDPECWDAWIPLMQMINSRTPQLWDAQLPHFDDVKNEIRNKTCAWRLQEFSPYDWIYQSLAYDFHDVGQSPGMNQDTAFALSQIKAKTLVMAPPLDLYNPAFCARWTAQHIRNSKFIEIDSEWGHQSASAADHDSIEFLNTCVGQFLNG